ncbi:cell wall biogenesis protein Mhp1 [Blumeria hordei DH14]|uniref:Cell wall biogenesis protein Mhp1 n=1 Tax=Blumeria graminis f. sp. hordei (strain DH14) TaxID=546991 RepID=N1JEZ1_BLUG1|nr:cell wall biogenesis protein Mhp1 [Blumeria hordei DH14]
MESIPEIGYGCVNPHASLIYPEGFNDEILQAHTTRRDILPASLKDARIVTDNGSHSKKKLGAVSSKGNLVSHLPTFSKTVSADRPTVSSNSSMTNRRNSWLSSISSRLSSASNSLQPPAISTKFPISANENADSAIPTSPKVAVVPKACGNSPHTPSSPRYSQSNFLQSAFRRLSNSGGLQSMKSSHEKQICERRILNVDQNRERCRIKELNGIKLRKVAFCVDVEVACETRYHDERDENERTSGKRQKKKQANNSEDNKNEIDTLNSIKQREKLDDVPSGATLGVANNLPGIEKESRKKQKKKRNEEERKARKEKKRELAEENGTLPIEVVKNKSDTSLVSSVNNSKAQSSPTTDPVRIYRRCCQLRETPILQGIIEQLADTKNHSRIPGVLHKIDLTGIWLELSNLTTLSDYLAIVPINELIMENCGLNDEGLRIILSSLLAAKCPSWESRRAKGAKDKQTTQGGFIEKVSLKNNPKIGENGWLYICTFIAMCRSLKSVDLSQIPFPQTPDVNSTLQNETLNSSRKYIGGTSKILGKAIANRSGGRGLELLNIAESGLHSNQLGDLVDGAIKSGLCRLGIAGNNISPEGIQHIVRFIREGHCEGLDLGGNNLRDQLITIAEALNEKNVLYALSLADCNLIPESLWALFPALVKLKNFRFIDLSKNPELFSSEPSALSLFRRYLPKIKTLKRIHLNSVSLTAEQAIALAEILPESQTLAHINIMDNPLRTSLVATDGKNKATQEEACALYASLMAAVRVSKSIICVDIEVPSPESSEIVKALAKQVVAYCLRNMEHGPVAEISANSDSFPEEEKEVEIPDVLLKLAGQSEKIIADKPDVKDSSAADEDYVIGGTGVVKALSICLRNRGNNSRPPSTLSETQVSRSTTNLQGEPAKDMSKNLLGSARNIRARLQPAVKEAKAGDAASFQRLLFLDETLDGIIRRFEDEFPETRLLSRTTSSAGSSRIIQTGSDENDSTELETPDCEMEPIDIETQVLNDNSSCLRPVISRHNSDVSLASRALGEEEGRIHRYGQQLKRSILNPDGSEINDKSVLVEWPVHLEMLRGMMEGMGGEEIKERILTEGHSTLFEELDNKSSALHQKLKSQDPEAWEKFVHSQEIIKRT